MSESNEIEELEKLSDAELEAEFLAAIRKLSPDQVEAVNKTMEQMLEEETPG